MKCVMQTHVYAHCRFVSHCVVVSRDKKGRPPYAVARDKPARNAFRRFMADYPYRYDYSTAQVCTCMTK